MLLALFLQDRVKTLTGLETQIDDLDGPEQSMEYVKTDRMSFNTGLLTSGESK